MLTSAICAKVIAEGGFDTNSADVSAATVLGWVNEQYRAIVAAAEWLREEVSLGNTVAGQAIYTLPDTVVQVSRLQVAGDDRWKVVDIEELWDLKYGRTLMYGYAVGVMAQRFDETSVLQKIELWPVPGTSGLAITAFGSVLPPDLTTSPDTTPRLPVDFHEDLADGAIGLGRLRVDEREDLAGPYLQKFQAAAGKLLKRRRSRLQEGAWQASVGGRR